MPIPNVELVRHMGVLIKPTSLATCLRKAKRQPTKLIRFLMDRLFTEDDLKVSSVKGKGGRPALDHVMDAILCKLFY